MNPNIHPTVASVTARIVERSQATRSTYLQRVAQQQAQGKSRPLSCGNLAHVVAASPKPDKFRIVEHKSANLGIITAYNDMLSAHQPFEHFPELIKQTARAAGATAQVAGGVPAMCDGVTQGQPGMDLSLFSRDVIAMSAAVGLSHNIFDGAIFLGVCDKIVPGLVIAAATFGHLPCIFLPAGPMVSGIANDEKAKIRQQYAAGQIGRDELLRGEMASYHSPGTCTFYGTANSNQMLMEFMGLQLPGSSFVNPHTPLREALTRAGVQQLLANSAPQAAQPVITADILTEQAFVNGMIGLHATGGSTNLVLHLVAMARAAGVMIQPEDFAELSAITPLMARVYPNGPADVNHFHAAGGLQFVMAGLLEAGLLHEDVQTVVGKGLRHYTQEPLLADEELRWQPAASQSHDTEVLRPVPQAFQATGGLIRLQGDLGEAVMKVSALKQPTVVIEAPAKVFHDQAAVKTAFEAGELEDDFICVVRFQGPKACGMPELHGLTPILSICQDRGQQVALVTDGRMSGASGKVPAAIHLSPEAVDQGPISRIQDGDIIRLDLANGSMSVVNADLAARQPVVLTDSGAEFGLGRELFGAFRQQVSSASEGASVLFGNQEAC